MTARELELDALREQAAFWRDVADQHAMYQTQALGRVLRLKRLIRDMEERASE